MNAISGFSLTEKNYVAAITFLKQRLGNQDMLFHAHLNNLLNISPIKNISDIHGLRNLYDNCETQIRSLEALGATENTYSCLLCQILLKLFPCELTLEFTRIQGNDKKIGCSESHKLPAERN
ncbi:uncharacterized protein NPIL_411001 [Nephila pilipes]|uniref:Uncharacterized protein n=1 Tax=Nephila pilipes TaxID=299642 RepID=A0A8X6IKU1_NEPPI|nr:uncharacterized protein NPIL_411001 [Nephila pilipes]